MEFCRHLMAHELFLLRESILKARLDCPDHNPPLATRYMEELCSLAKDVRSVSELLQRLLDKMSRGEELDDEVHANVFHRALALSSVIERAERPEGGKVLLV